MKYMSKKGDSITTNRKNVWYEIRDDFCNRFPNLAMKVEEWEAFAFMTILIKFEDGTRGSYNMETRTLKMSRE